MKEQKTMISIVIPVYNVCKYIENTLKSCFFQTSSDYEVIIVDDGSTDNTFDIAFKYLQSINSNNFKIIRTSNNGVSSARNTGIYNSCGEYILFLDGDDTIQENLVSNLLEKAKNHSYDMIVFGFDRVDNSGNICETFFSKYRFANEETDGYEALLRHLVYNEFAIWTSSAVYNRNLLVSKNISFTNGCTSGEDSEFILKALANSSKVCYLNMVLSKYYIRNGSVTNRYNIRRLDLIEAIIRTKVNIENVYKGKNIKQIEFALNEIIINGFIRTFLSCLDYKKEEVKDNIKALSILENDIRNQYPNIHRDLSAIKVMQLKQFKFSKSILKLLIIQWNANVYVRLMKNLKGFTTQKY